MKNNRLQIALGVLWRTAFAMQAGGAPTDDPIRNILFVGVGAP